MKSKIDISVYDQVWNKIKIQVRSQDLFRVIDQVYDQVWDPVEDIRSRFIFCKIWGAVWYQVSDPVLDQMDIGHEGSNSR